MKLTATQTALLDKLAVLTYPATYDSLKQHAEVNSFDTTFNALLNKGYFKRIETNDFSNQFIKI